MKPAAPERPAPLEAADVEETALAMPGVRALVDLGFHWHVCARTLVTSEMNVERAAEALFTMEGPEEALAELAVCAPGSSLAYADHITSSHCFWCEHVNVDVFRAACKHTMKLCPSITKILLSLRRQT